MDSERRDIILRSSSSSNGESVRHAPLYGSSVNGSGQGASIVLSPVVL